VIKQKPNGGKVLPLGPQQSRNFLSFLLVLCVAFDSAVDHAFL
jgi:hypothetical protein